MLQIEEISKQYTTGDFVQKALDSVSLNLRDSEFVAILGPSGSGKTTLLNIIGGLDRYDSGDLVINGTSTRLYKDRDWDSYRNHTIGFVFQSYNLIGHQTVLSNVELALTISGVSRSERRERARKALETVGLGEHVNKRPNQLSGGQMQRVAIARALVNDPDIVLADEPTGALDSDTSVQIMDLLKAVAKDRLVVMVTHNPELARQYATRVVELRDGVIRDDSDPYEIQDGAQAPALHRNLGRASMSFATSLALSFNNLKTKKARTLLTAFAGSIGIIGIALIMSVSTGVNRYIDAIQQDTMTAYPISIDEQTWDLSKLMDANQQADEERSAPAKNRDGIYPDDSGVKSAASVTSSIATNNLTAFKKYLDNPKSEIRQYIGKVGVQYSYDSKFSVFDRDPSGTLVNADGVTIGDTNSTGASQMAAQSGSSSDMSGVQSAQMSMLTGKSEQNTAPGSFGEIMPGGSDKDLVSKVISDNYTMVEGAWPKDKSQVLLVLDKNNGMPLTTLYELGLLPASDYTAMMTKINNGEDVKTPTAKLDYSKALDQTLFMLPASSQYVKQADGHYRYVGDAPGEIENLTADAMKLKVVGIVKPTADAKATPLATGVGYTRALTDYLIDEANASQIVADQRADQTRNVLNGMTFSPSDDKTKAADAKIYVASLGVSQKASLAKAQMAQAAQSEQQENQGGQGGSASDQAAAQRQLLQAASMSEQQLADRYDAYIATAPQTDLVKFYDTYVQTGTYNDNLADFGVISRDAPSSIKIYADSFDAKNSIGDAIDQYNSTASKADKIVYTDYVGLMMNSVTTIINVITYVLIAFVAVSLIVSSIMIGIITYISVLERTKEIGILRAMGASKHNVSQVFNAETGIIGALAGILGVGITLLLIIPGNAIMHHFMGTDQVNAALPITASLILIALSILLTLIGGLIPSHKAARQDPATALRTE
ncbi:ABC transporter ATP-binding protein/permease [Bifidobacterium sp.]|uniref:ABC transporter ATP-binding protein/permease n=1 Tax=Bifidobacterium sp. TaxID=41200 RepID=UPI0025C17DC1|nr:ABC transporter ATP-binding protein/permease [Bifidobacterium sp.]MCH4209610.1 ABC transporter ATP-binding protein/permease [Bifidobacterium sp.]MCI1225177.1 ABC transporter ATP-binding protein/permease [Bifidobacterium sp.]